MTAIRRILVIEADPSLRKALREILNEEGWLLTEANSGKTYTSLGRKVPSDLAIVDLELPDMDGLQLIRNIRSASAQPIMAISTCPDENRVIETFDAGN